MWVRIDEISFASERAEDVVDEVRNSAVTRHEGDGFRGFRLLVDQPHGRALDVSYWDTGEAASTGGATSGSDQTVTTSAMRSCVYEMRIDSV
jgi:heme-degrading monooxygenase HmoA